MDSLLIALILIAAAWAVATSILIARYLERRGHSISILWFRAMIFKYIGQYRQITRQETGRVGPLFYHYVVPLLVLLALAITLAVANL